MDPAPYVQFGPQSRGSRFAQGAVAAALLFSLVGLVSMQARLLQQQQELFAAQRDISSVLVASGDLALRAEQPPPVATISLNALPSDLPSKYLVDYVTPSSDQGLRGDCYLFATAGILESSYVQYGVAKGWLNGSTFLRLSRQALGIALMDECKKHPTEGCPTNKIEGVGLVMAETVEGDDGGDEHVFRYLPGLGRTGAVPDSMCPYSYTEGAEKERECDGLSRYQEVNPLRFKVNGMKHFYDRMSMKAALVRGGNPLSLGMQEIDAPFYQPCDERYGCDPKAPTVLEFVEKAKKTLAVPTSCVGCPLERVYKGVECCVLAKKAMVTMNGEWYTVPGEPLFDVGGHAVNIVGYNDYYRDEFGNTGGFILRNTWKDGLGIAHGQGTRGSHTARYYNKDLDGANDEPLSCPNPHSPRSWGTCKDLAECKKQGDDPQNKDGLLRLKCTDTGFALPEGACDKDVGYFMANRTEWGMRGLFVTCFIYEGEHGTSQSMCLPPLTVDDVATVFTPHNIDDVKVNDPLLCGFNFLPYATFEILSSRLGGVVASRFDIEWSQTSYLSNADRRKYDYSLLEKSLLARREPKTKQPEHYSQSEFAV